VTALDWLSPVRRLFPELAAADWALLGTLEDRLGCLDRNGEGGRSGQLLAARRDLAVGGYTMLTLPADAGGCGRPVVLQALAQFVCGWHDLDLRDATGAGHGAMVLDAAPAARDRWLSRLRQGELIGVAATERHGGSRIQEITTRATLGSRGRWLICGEKTWVSRLTEAAGLVVFFRDPDGHISAAIIDAGNPGLERELITPAGLDGWSWGILRLHQAVIDPRTDLIGAPGMGLAVFRDHFARFRPLVAATALGAAAAAHASITQALAARVRVGVLPRVRDNVLVSLGRTHAELNAALLPALTATVLGQAGDPVADLWARAGKAHAVDTALAIIDELAPFTGAAGFTAASPLVKTRADLAALRYADGIHDSLYRSAGKTLLAGTQPSAQAAVLPLPRPAEPVTA
jgi:alkylation response protein AidB-like acyl-CoA dehydrogenase